MDKKLIASVESVQRYEYNDASQRGKCTMCWKETWYRYYDILEKKFLHMCETCAKEENKKATEFPFPIRVTTRANLKNSFFVSASRFPRDISGSPERWEPVNLRSHLMFMTRERARKEGLLPEE